MSGEGIAAILVGLGTFLSGLVLAWRGLSGDRFQRKVTESAALLTGYTEMVANLRTEIREVREANALEVDRQQRHHRSELETVNLLHSEDRRRWDLDRDRLVERIDALEEQVAALLDRPTGSRDRADDPKPG